MTEQEIKLARERYNKVVPNEKKEHLKQMKTELLMLEQNDVVKRYIELKNQTIKTENEINDPANLIFAFDELSSQTQESSNFYLAIGYFSVITGLESFISLSEDNPNSHYKYYINVETGKLEIINRENIKTFEENKIVINAKSVLTEKGNNLDKLNEIRKVYFNYLLENEQQEAIQKTKKKVEKNEI